MACDLESAGLVVKLEKLHRLDDAGEAEKLAGILAEAPAHAFELRGRSENIRFGLELTDRRENLFQLRLLAAPLVHESLEIDSPAHRCVSARRLRRSCPIPLHVLVRVDPAKVGGIYGQAAFTS